MHLPAVTVCPFCADVLRAFFLLSISSYGMHATKLVHLAQFVALGWVVYHPYSARARSSSYGFTVRLLK